MALTGERASGETVFEKMANESELRERLIEVLQGANAHIPFVEAVRGFPIERAGERPGGSPHSAWELLEHIRIAQEDIVLFCGGATSVMPTDKNPPEGYLELKWPDDYWPASVAPENALEWNRSVNRVQEDLARFVRLLRDPGRDLLEPFPWGSGQTILREALLIADHTAYHVGQLMLIRRMLEGGG